MPTRRCCLCRSKKTPKVSLHSFPKDTETSNLWKERCDIRLTDCASGFYVCSKHFTPGDYVEPRAKEFGGKMMLKPKRFPTVKVPNPVIVPVPSKSLPQPKPLIIAAPSTSSSKLPQSELAEPAMRIEAVMCAPKKKKFAEPHYVGDITSPDFATRKTTRIAWHVSKVQLKLMKFENRALKEKNRRLMKKVTALQDILKRLRENNFHSEDAAEY